MPTKRKIPLRKCVVTGEQLPKQSLIRVVKTKENACFVDPTGKMNGRGAYLKKSLAVVEKARKTKRLERHLGIAIDDAIYDKLTEIIRDGE